MASIPAELVLLPDNVQMKILSYFQVKQIFILRAVNREWKGYLEGTLAKMKHVSFKKLAAEIDLEVQIASSGFSLNLYEPMIRCIFKYCNQLECFNGDKYPFAYDWFDQTDAKTGEFTIAQSLRKLVDVQLIWINGRIERSAKCNILCNFHNLTELIIRDKQNIDLHDLKNIFTAARSSLKMFSMVSEKSTEVSFTPMATWSDKRINELIQDLPEHLDALELVLPSSRVPPQVHVMRTSNLRGLSLRNVALSMPFKLPCLLILKCSISDLNGEKQKDFWTCLSHSVNLTYLSISVRYIASADMLEADDEPDDEEEKEDELAKYLENLAHTIDAHYAQLKFLDFRLQNILMPDQANRFCQHINPQKRSLHFSFATLPSIILTKHHLTSLLHLTHVNIHLASAKSQHRISHQLRITPANAVDKQARPTDDMAHPSSFRMRGEFDSFYFIPSL